MPILSRMRNNYLIGYDFFLRCWAAPFYFQPIDVRVANRSNALINQKYGQNLICRSFTLPFTPFSTYEPSGLEPEYC